MTKYGSYYVRKDRKNWLAVVNYQQGGKQRRLTRSTGVPCNKVNDSGKRKAQQFLDAFRDELMARESLTGEVGKRDPNQSTFAAYALEWVRIVDVKPSTRRGYLSGVRRIAASTIGSIPLNEVGRKDVMAFDAELREEGLASTTVRGYHAVVVMVMRHAKACGDIVHDPTEGLKPPKKRTTRPNSMKPEDVQPLLEEAAAHAAEPMGVAVALALMCGMRRGEICALRWDDIDFASKTIHVVRAVTRGREGEGLLLSSPKDTNGGDETRDIPLPPSLLPILQERQRAQRTEVADMGSLWCGSVYVAGDALLGTPFSPDDLTHQWEVWRDLRRLVGTTGGKIRFHDLRHTFGTLAVANGMDVLSVASIMGHRNPTVTLQVYCSPLMGVKRQGMDALDKAFFARNVDEDIRAAKGAA